MCVGVIHSEVKCSIQCVTLLVYNLVIGRNEFWYHNLIICFYCGVVFLQLLQTKIIHTKLLRNKGYLWD